MTVMACVVVLITVYALILPAITMTNDLSKYLTKAEIMVDGKEYAGDETLPATKEFAVSLAFSNITAAKDETISYTYTLPKQIALPKDITDGVLVDASGAAQGNYTVTKNASTGQYVITVNFNEEYAKENNYLDISLELSAQWNVDGSGEVDVDFGNDHVKKVKIDADTELSIDKTHRMTGKRSATYSIVVEAMTAQTDLQLTDTVTHQSVTYTDESGVSKTESIGAVLKVGGTIEAVLTDKNGNIKNSDKRTIEDQTTLTNYLSWLNEQKLSMAAGDKLTITYPMEFAESTVYTADAYDLTLKTTNTATVSSAEETEQLSASEQWSYYGKKSNIIQKTGEMVSENNDSLRWDLTMNAGGNYPMAGTVVYDKLQSDKLKYDTSKPFVVEVYDGKKLANTITVSDWINNDQELTLSTDGSGWEYTIPTLTEDGTEQYTYKIIYYTTVTNYDGSALNNAAGARFNQYPPVGIIGQATKVDIGIEKIGELRKTEGPDSNTVQWTIRYTVHPGSGVINQFRIADYLPSYKDKSGATQYAVLVDASGNTLNIGEDITTASHNGDAFIITVADYITGSDYTENDTFAFLKSYRAYYNDKTNFAISNAETGFTLPAAVEDYKNGYVVTVKYLTQSPNIALNEIMDNRAEGLFSDLSGNAKTISANAKVGLNTEDLEDSVNVDKTGKYDADSGKVHYTVKVDTENVGFAAADTVTITDTFDSRLSFDAGSYDMTLSLGSASVSGTIALKEQNSTNIVTTKVTNADGTTTWKTVFPTTQLYAEGRGSTPIPVEVWATIDNTDHTFSVYLPYLYTYGETLQSLTPVTYQIDYDLTPGGTSRVYTDVTNTVEAVGDNDVVYGKATTTFSFGQNITSKTLTDAEKHTHSTEECYTYDIYKGQVLTCPLSETVTNEVRFKVRVDFGASELKNMTELTIDDYMDTNKLPPDMSKVWLQFVGKIPSGEQTALSFDDICTLAGVQGASYTTEITSTGLSVDITLGTLNGQKCTVEKLISAFYDSSVVQNLAGGTVNLGEWKLELSYPAAVKGNVGETVRVTNNANLRGIENSGSEVEYDKVIQGSSGGVEGKSYTLNIEKIDSTVTGTTITYLPGATFNLCDQNGNILATATTDANGKAVFGKQGASGSGYCDLQPYTAYYLVETSASGGYIADKTKHWFYFTAPTGTAEQQAFTENEKAELEALGCVPVSMDATIRITNSKETFFKIKKVDSKTGETLAGAEFRLYSDSSCQNEVQTARTSGDGIYLLDGLIPGKTYYLKETHAPPGYELDKTVYTVTVAEDGTVTIKNVATNENLEWDESVLAYLYENSKESYVLPETGGSGTLMFTIGGMLLLAGNLLYGFALRQIRYMKKSTNQKEKKS